MDLSTLIDPKELSRESKAAEALVAQFAQVAPGLVRLGFSLKMVLGHATYDADPHPRPVVLSGHEPKTRTSPTATLDVMVKIIEEEGMFSDGVVSVSDIHAGLIRNRMEVKIDTVSGYLSRYKDRFTKVRKGYWKLTPEKDHSLTALMKAEQAFKEVPDLDIDNQEPKPLY